MLTNILVTCETLDIKSIIHALRNMLTNILVTCKALDTLTLFGGLTKCQRTSIMSKNYFNEVLVCLSLFD